MDHTPSPGSWERERVSTDGFMPHQLPLSSPAACNLRLPTGPGTAEPCHSGVRKLRSRSEDDQAGPATKRLRMSPPPAQGRLMLPPHPVPHSMDPLEAVLCHPDPDVSAPHSHSHEVSPPVAGLHTQGQRAFRALDHLIASNRSNHEGDSPVDDDARSDSELSVRSLQGQNRGQNALVLDKYWGAAAAFTVGRPLPPPQRQVSLPPNVSPQFRQTLNYMG